MSLSPTELGVLDEWLGDYMMEFLRSPKWTVPIKEFIDENCIVFDNEEENKFSYTESHNEFKLLLESLLASELLSLDLSMEEFEQFVEDKLEEKDEELYHALLDNLTAAEDFLKFKSMMVRRNYSLQVEAMEAMGYADRSISTLEGIMGGEGGEEEEEVGEERRWKWYAFVAQLLEEEERQLQQALLESRLDSLSPHRQAAPVPSELGRGGAEPSMPQEGPTPDSDDALQQAIALSLQMSAQQAELKRDRLREEPGGGREGGGGGSMAQETRQMAPQVATQAPLQPVKGWMRGGRGEGEGGGLPPLNSPGTFSLEAVEKGQDTAQPAPALLPPQTAALESPLSDSSVSRRVPSKDEVQARAERLKKQREMLMEKKRQERESEMAAYNRLVQVTGQDSPPPSSLSPQGLKEGSEGARLVAELTRGGGKEEEKKDPLKEALAGTLLP